MPGSNRTLWSWAGPGRALTSAVSAFAGSLYATFRFEAADPASFRRALFPAFAVLLLHAGQSLLTETFRRADRAERDDPALEAVPRTSATALFLAGALCLLGGGLCAMAQGRETALAAAGLALLLLLRAATGSGFALAGALGGASEGGAFLLGMTAYPLFHLVTMDATEMAPALLLALFLAAVRAFPEEETPAPSHALALSAVVALGVLAAAALLLPTTFETRLCLGLSAGTLLLAEAAALPATPRQRGWRFRETAAAGGILLAAAAVAGETSAAPETLRIVAFGILGLGFLWTLRTGLGRLPA